jgi:hypothetical protein
MAGNDGPERLSASPLHALDVEDAFDLRDPAHDLAETVDVADPEVEQVFGASVLR